MCIWATGKIIVILIQSGFALALLRGVQDLHYRQGTNLIFSAILNYRIELYSKLISIINPNSNI